MKLLTGTDAAITSPVFTAADGYTPTDADALPTCVVTKDSTGAAVGGVVVTDVGAGVYTASFEAIADPDLLNLVWTGQVAGKDRRLTQQVEVVGGVYVTLAELMTLPGLDATKHPVALRSELLDTFEGIAEQWRGWAWVPRYAVEVHDMDRRPDLMLGHPRPRAILSATDEDGDPIDTSDWELLPTGRVDGAWLWGKVTIKIHHGADAPPPALAGAAKDYVRAKALARTNRVGRDELSTIGPDGGSTRFSTPDWYANRPTGLLDVDAVIVALGGGPDSGFA